MKASNTLQTIMRKHLPDYITTHRVDVHKQTVCRHIKNCRSEVMGGLQMQCNHCGDRPIIYFACRDRHCPHCQMKETLEWRDKQLAALLPVTYYHVVFTLPHELNGWVQLHPSVVYRLLFKVVWKTLSTFGADPRRLNGKLGMTAVLHTWGKNLSRHVHLHCLVPGGALMANGQWKTARSTYLFPVRALSRHFRGGLVSEFRSSIKAGELSRLQDGKATDQTLSKLMDKEWVVYCKHCINLAETVVSYLSRYTHRIAVSEHRMIYRDNQVMLIQKDYKDEGRLKGVTLGVEEFIRRYLMHIVPKGLMRVRHFGFLANCCRKKRLKQIREILDKPIQGECDETTDALPSQRPGQMKTDNEATQGYPCRECKEGLLWVVGKVKPRLMSYG